MTALQKDHAAEKDEVLSGMIVMRRCEVNRNRILYVAISSMILLALACNLPGQLADQVGDQIEQRLEDRLNEALESTGAEELTQDLKGIAEQFTGQDLGELMSNFTAEDWPHEDIPLPPDAKILAGYAGGSEGDFILLETSMDIDEAEIWMLNSLNEKGWSQGELNLEMELARAFDLSKGEQKLGLVMNESLTGDGANISITVYR